MKNLLLIFLLFCLSASALDLNLRWPSNAAPNITSYRLSYGTNINSLTQSVVVNGFQTTLTGLDDAADYFFSVTALGNTSAPPSDLTASLRYSFGSGFSLLSGQLFRSNNVTALGVIYTNFPDGAIFYLYDPILGYQINEYYLQTWVDPNQRFDLGRGAWLYNPLASNFNYRAWGHIANSFTQNISASTYVLIGPAIPKSGLLQQDLGFVPQNGDFIYRWGDSFWNIYYYDFNQWNVQPYINKSDAFFIYRMMTTNWVISR